ARAVLGHVAFACRGPADGRARLENVVGTRCRRAGALLDHVADAGGRSADGRAGRERIERTDARAARARFLRIAWAGAGAAHRAGRPERTGAGAARDRRSVGGTFVTLLVVRGLHDAVAARAHGIRRVPADCSGTVAAIERAGVAVVGAADALRLQDVRRTGGGRARARLREVAFAGGGTALCGGRLELIGRTPGGRAVTRLRHVAHAGGRSADHARY